MPDHCTRPDGSLCPAPDAGCSCDKYVLTKDGLLALVEYIVAVRVWIAAAHRCLAPWQTARMPGKVIKLCGRRCS